MTTNPGFTPEREHAVRALLIEEVANTLDTKPKSQRRWFTKTTVGFSVVGALTLAGAGVSIANLAPVVSPQQLPWAASTEQPAPSDLHPVPLESNGEPATRDDGADPFPTVTNPAFPTNEYGQTYGVQGYGAYKPDLVAVEGLNFEGEYVEGYVNATDMMTKLDTATPEQVKEWSEAGTLYDEEGPREIPMFEVDGKTQIGTFLMGA